jgi:uncharacterized protein YcfL
VAGCGANTYSTAEPMSNVGTERVMRNPGLAADINVVATRLDEKAGVKYAQVTVRNESGSRKAVRYRFDWFDADGMAIEGLNSKFVSVEIGAGESQEIRSAGPQRATDFRFTIAR